MKALCFALLLVFASVLQAGSPGVYKNSARAPLDDAYQWVYSALEENNFYVVSEINIGQSLARFGEKWGDDYNRSGLQGIRSMIVCNGWYANQVGNADPDMLVFCPLHVNLVHKDGVTTVLFARPTALAGDSAAHPVLTEVEETVIDAIEQGLASAGNSPQDK